METCLGRSCIPSTYLLEHYNLILWSNSRATAFLVASNVSSIVFPALRPMRTHADITRKATFPIVDPGHPKS